MSLIKNKQLIDVIPDISKNITYISIYVLIFNSLFLVKYF